jgi:hypothetical protein
LEKSLEPEQVFYGGLLHPRGREEGEGEQRFRFPTALQGTRGKEGRGGFPKDLPRDVPYGRKRIIRALRRIHPARSGLGADKQAKRKKEKRDEDGF